MNAFTYQNGQMYAEDIPVADLAEAYGTPLYVYSRSHLTAQYRALKQAMASVDPLICYAVKANSNAAVISTFASEGAGADVVSGGELYRARRAGVPAAPHAFRELTRSRAAFMDDPDLSESELTFYEIEAVGERIVRGNGPWVVAEPQDWHEDGRPTQLSSIHTIVCERRRTSMRLRWLWAP